MRLPDLKIVLTGTPFGYKRDDGVFVIPIGCLKTENVVVEQMGERDISIADVTHCIENGEIIEDYPNVIKFEDDLKTRRD